MESQVELKLLHRVLNRRSIETSISDHASLLDKAWMTFHVRETRLCAQLTRLQPSVSDGILD